MRLLLIILFLTAAPNAGGETQDSARVELPGGIAFETPLDLSFVAVRLTDTSLIYYYERSVEDPPVVLCTIPIKGAELPSRTRIFAQGANSIKDVLLEALRTGERQEIGYRKGDLVSAEFPGGLKGPTIKRIRHHLYASYDTGCFRIEEEGRIGPEEHKDFLKLGLIFLVIVDIILTVSVLDSRRLFRTSSLIPTKVLFPAAFVLCLSFLLLGLPTMRIPLLVLGYSVPYALFWSGLLALIYQTATVKQTDTGRTPKHSEYDTRPTS